MVKRYVVTWIGGLSGKKQEQHFHKKADAEFLIRMQKERGRKVDQLRVIDVPKKRRRR